MQDEPLGGVDPVQASDSLYRRLARGDIKADGKVDTSAFPRSQSDLSLYLERLTSAYEVSHSGERGKRGVGIFSAKIPIGFGIKVVRKQVEGIAGHAHHEFDREISRPERQHIADNTEVVPSYDPRTMTDYDDPRPQDLIDKYGLTNRQVE